MYIHVEWQDHTYTTLIWRFSGEWNTYDLHMAWSESYALMGETDERIDIIAVVEDSAIVAQGDESLAYYGILFPRNFGTFIVVNSRRNHNTVATLTDILFRRSNYPVLWVNTTVAADRVIRNMRSFGLNFSHPMDAAV